MSPSSPAGPVPTYPATIQLPNVQVTKKTISQLTVPPGLSFYYAGISSMWLWYEIPLEILRAYLDPLGMTPYSFEGKGAVNVNFFNAATMYGTGAPGSQGVGGFNETEINIIAFATKIAANVPMGLTLEQYLTVGDPTKRLGNYRVWVACDDAVAVAAGRQVYQENKFQTSYTYNVPAPNNPRPAPNQFSYDWTCHDPKHTKLKIYSAAVNLTGLSAVPGNMSEVIDLSFDASTRRPVASRRNYFGLYDTYLQPGLHRSVALSYGTSKHAMRHDMQRLIGTHRCAAIQLFRSAPCIAEWAGYFADL